MQNSQAFTTKFSGRTNVLFNEVGVSQAFDPNTARVNQPKITEIKSIWDTGATNTVITKKYALQIGLISSGKATMNVVNHSVEADTYLVNIYLPSKVCLPFVRIAEAEALTGDAGMLIGMDIIGAGDFSVYLEDEKTVMTYRLPSVGGVDFVAEENSFRKHQAELQKIENEKKNRKPLSEKEKQKRKQAKMNLRRNRKRGR